ncbi:hypothetical protein [Actinoplanes sp. NPDC026619]|uniref:hypothetical protein n=1 Tax=Actinoplanes sp. NPDC026619 TaxID=3155798 RepID=UPI0033FB6DEA
MDRRYPVRASALARREGEHQNVRVDENKRRLSRDESIALLARPLTGVFSTCAAT